MVKKKLVKKENKNDGMVGCVIKMWYGCVIHDESSVMYYKIKKRLKKSESDLIQFEFF